MTQGRARPSGIDDAGVRGQGLSEVDDVGGRAESGLI